DSKQEREHIPTPLLRRLAVIVIHHDQGIVNHLVQRCWYPSTLSMAYYGAVNGIDFNTPLALKIHCHGRLSQITGSVQVVHRARHDLGRYTGPSLGHAGGFLHDSAKEPARGFMCQEL